jgi:spore coat protein A, manganese oxidase
VKLRKIQTALFLVLLVLCTITSSWAQQGTPLPGSKIAQFVDPLPLLSVAPGGNMQTVLPSIFGGTDTITLRMVEAETKIMPTGFVPANGLPYTGTWVFRYVADSGAGVIGGGDPNTYVGPVIVAARSHPTEIKYVNNLTANHIFWREWTDQSLHSAFHQITGMTMPMLFDPQHYLGPVPAVPHLHGGEDPAVIDGGPEAYFLSDEVIPGYDNAFHGLAYYSKTNVAPNEAIYRYPNSQEASPLWFHDHLLGGTRLNATFAGLAGAYALIDPNLTLPVGLHPVGLQNTDGSNLRYVVPLVIQDRMFDTNGQLYFPTDEVNPEHPYWVPEFVGDTIVVNGKVWPFLNVDHQRYRLYLINGSNSRPYQLFLQDPVTKIKGPRMWVIATDGGYLDRPVLIDPNATKASGVPQSLVMMPGERYEIIVDFADPAWPLKGQAVNLILRNTASTVEGPPNGMTEGRIMQFRVSANTPVDTSYNPASGTPIRTGEQAIKRLVNPVSGALNVTPNKTRELVLVEIAGSTGDPLEVLVNNSKWNGIRDDGTSIPGATLINGNYLTELPVEGQIEVWEVVNTTADAHPIHLHGVQFQILNRQPFKTSAFFAAYSAAFSGGAFIPAYGPPLDYNPSSESGFKYGGNPDVGPYLQGAARPQLAFEAGWKDTAIMPSGSVTRIAVRFAPQSTAIGAIGSFIFDPSAASSNGQPGYYVWHCHITDHEDNEMMRPYMFQDNPAAIRSYLQGVDY